MKQLPVFVLIVLILLVFWFNDWLVVLAGKLFLVILSIALGFFYGTYYAKYRIDPSWTPQKHLNFLLTLIKVK